MLIIFHVDMMIYPWSGLILDQRYLHMVISDHIRSYAFMSINSYRINAERCIADVFMVLSSSIHIDIHFTIFQLQFYLMVT